MAERDGSVLFEELAAAGSRRLGMATLDAPATLNGLSLAMVQQLAERLAAWAADPAIAMVVLRGAGERAFSAGGDLQALYRSILQHRASGSRDVRDNAYAAEFFALEYRLDHAIHTCRKPVLAWGNGYVMGGGIGLFGGASHRVVTETSRLAMPEISIGLYPDVGGSWLLDRVPGRAGRFLALTGAQLDASDAIFAGLADWSLPQARYPALIDALRHLAWHDERADNDRLLEQTLREFAAPVSAGPLRRHFDAISDACRHANLEDAVAAIGALPDEDAWLAKAKATLAAGAPSSARLGWEMQRHAHQLSLADTFRLEYGVSLHCAAHGDFGEGIRALLIDKDRQPRWRPATLAEATPSWAAAFFDTPWRAGEHPLADLR